MHVVATAGHVDHGKSTLLRAITGQEPDRWAEERRRGLTIDLGFVWCDLPGGATVAFVDVPGHHRFIDNALAGAGAVEDVLLVVAADDGWSAQTQEHVEIAHVLGLRAAVVAVTKTGRVDAARVDEVVADVGRRLVDTALAGAPIVRLDALSGDGVDHLVAALDERLSGRGTPDLGHDRARLWIDRAFSVSGTGTVVTGTLAGGRVAVGDEVLLVPAGRTVRIRGLQSLGRRHDDVTGPARVAVALSDVTVDEVGRGDAIVTGGALGPAATAWLATRELDTWATALPGRTLGRTGDWVAHIGSARLPATVLPVSGDLAEPDERHPDRRADGPVRILLSRPVPTLTGDRIVLRETGRRSTMGGAVVLDPDPQGPLPRGAARSAFAERLADLAVRMSDPAADLVHALVQGGARPLVRLRAATARAVGETTATVTMDVAIDPPLATAAVAAILTAATSPRPADTLVDAAGQNLPRPARAALVRGLVEDGQLTASPDGLVAAGVADEVTAARSQRVETLLTLLTEAGLNPPKLAEAAAEAGTTRVEVQQLIQRGELVKIGDLALTRAHHTAAIETIRTLAESGPFTASEAKAAWSTTRRTAIPLLENLDARGITIRDGETRTLRT